MICLETYVHQVEGVHVGGLNPLSLAGNISAEVESLPRHISRSDSATTAGADNTDQVYFIS